MKKILLLIWLTGVSCCAIAARRDSTAIHPGFGDGRYELSVQGEYAYNKTWEHMGNLDVKALMPINPHFELQAQAQLSTANVYTMAAIMRPKFALPTGEMFLETELMYKCVNRAKQHDFCLGLALGYRMDYVSVQVGWYGRMLRPYHMDVHSDMKGNFEVNNIWYRLKVWVRPQTCNWNLYLGATNVDDYLFERHWQHMFYLGGQYDVDNHWRIIAETEYKVSGMFHLNANFYGAYLRTGFTYRF